MSLYRIIRGEVVLMDEDRDFPAGPNRKLGTFVSNDQHEYAVYDTANCEPTELWVGVVGQNILSRERETLRCSGYTASGKLSMR